MTDGRPKKIIVFTVGRDETPGGAVVDFADHLGEDLGHDRGDALGVGECLVQDALVGTPSSEMERRLVSL